MELSGYLARMRFAHKQPGSGRLHRHFMLVLVVFGLVATACGGGANATASDADTFTSAADGLTGEFATFTETPLDLETLQGDDVVLWFWAPW